MTKVMQEYLSPFFTGQGMHLSVGFLGKSYDAASISAVPDTKVLRYYTDGDRMLKSAFSLMVRFPYGVNGTEEIDAFFESLHEDLKAKNNSGILPELAEDGFAVSVESDLSAKNIKNLADSCIYTVKIYLTHYKPNQKGKAII